MWPNKPQFFGVRAAAANIGHSRGSYSADMFRADFPQFFQDNGTGLVGVMRSAKLGQDSVTYDTDPLTKATESWGDLNATQYGQLLATKARLVGMGGTYVI